MVNDSEAYSSVLSEYEPMSNNIEPKDPLEGRFLSMLTDDRAQASMSYVEFLCHIHRQIQSKFQ